MIALIKACFIIFTLLFYTSTHATMTFGSKISSVTIQNAASQVRINPSTVYGWNNKSIKKNKTGVGLGDYNLRSYGNGDQTVTYAELPTELIYNNSNEIARLAQMARTNSNAAAFGIKNNSNTIMRAITSNSHGIITISRSVRTNSNAFTRSIRNNSEAIFALHATTSNIIQQFPEFPTRHIVLGNNSFTQGLKRFNNGFTILAGQSATVDTCLSVSGAFSLQESGQLNLRGNVRLDGNTTLTSGGTCPNTAVTMARLGVPTTLISAVGADKFGNLFVEECERSGLESRIERVQGTPTARSVS